jgi:cytochrome c556
LLVGCGGSGTPAEPTAHLRQADRICAGAQPRFDRSGEGIVSANQAYEQSRSRSDLDTIQRIWDDVWYALSSTGKELRAAAKPGLDKDYDQFVAAWEQMTAQADSLVDVIDDGDPQVITDSFREVQARGRELQQAARTAGVERCEAPLSPGGQTRDA